MALLRLKHEATEGTKTGTMRQNRLRKKAAAMIHVVMNQSVNIIPSDDKSGYKEQASEKNKPEIKRPVTGKGKEEANRTETTILPLRVPTLKEIEKSRQENGLVRSKVQDLTITGKGEIPESSTNLEETIDNNVE